MSRRTQRRSRQRLAANSQSPTEQQASEAQASPSAAKTPQQELLAFLAERGWTLQIIAIGKKTGQPANAADFWQHTTHDLDIMVLARQPVQAEDATDDTDDCT